MQDFFNQPLNIGDEVAVIEPDYRNLITGTIISFAPKSMLIEYIKDYSHRLDGGKKYPTVTFRATSNQVIKKHKE